MEEYKIRVGKGSCGIAAGAAEIFDYLKQNAPEGCETAITGCVGMCYLEPIVNAGGKVFVKVDKTAAGEILKYIRGEKNEADKHMIAKHDSDIQNAQTRIALKNCGVIDPENIAEYIENQGYEAAKKCLTKLSPEQVIDEIKISELCGRGGAGFPTWFKWNAAKNSEGEKKYVICNADEGDPGAFMDRAIIEGDPHAVIEGMLIAAYSIGSDEGIVYVRAEYPLATARLDKALKQARGAGMLGDDIFGSGFCFDISIKAGAGAFVCGEETALIASLEGERGMPRLKPPFPAQKGYQKKPSNINNVETYANVPWIIRSTGANFAKMGTANSKGTKVFALTGKIARGGLVEVPMGVTIGEVIYNLGGGIKENKKFKAVQMGGPSGGCIPAFLADTQIDYKTLAGAGAMMGSGGMVVMDENTCMVDMARFFLDFTVKESCGKCTHCRQGNKRMLEILERICGGEGKEDDIERLGELAAQIKEGSLCALGQTAPNPVLTTLRYFGEEYKEHIIQKKCAARQCKALSVYIIDPDKCAGCTVCAKKCPTGAIAGTVKKPHSIIQEKCVKCQKCINVCKFGAIQVNQSGGRV